MFCKEHKGIKNARNIAVVEIRSSSISFLNEISSDIQHHLHHVGVLHELEGRRVDMDGVKVHLGLHLLLFPPQLLVQRHVGAHSRKVDLLAAGRAAGAASAPK